MSNADEILEQLSADNGEEYHRLHSGEQPFELTNSRMRFNEAKAKKQLKAALLSKNHGYKVVSDPFSKVPYYYVKAVPINAIEEFFKEG